ncbi:LuxR C-terminal-related transcriptional regulator [Pedobacter sp. SYSU D00535]|uniref:LuxR C-terminal-related transcriptional regulator n=1 Tax=Pedobacter sp. SYSU D00535 TaxID=2810308 RepID=UPI001A96E7C2|nr:LuxR C-terminal-related transcriptional regulator [Pedobacter sp. SYSU D00535]
MPQATYLTDDLQLLAGYSRELNEDSASYERLQWRAPHEPLKSLNGYSCIFNWRLMSYEFVSPSIQTVLGYSDEEFLDKGLKLFFQIIHPSDLEQFRDIHLCIFNYYYTVPAEERQKLVFCYNFRARTAEGSYRQILRQSSFTDISSDGKPGLEFINATDITNFSPSEHLTLTIHTLSDSGRYVLCFEKEFSEPTSILSQREREVMELVKQGMTTRKIAERLFVSVETIKSHRKNIIAKMGVGNMAAAVNVAGK